MEKPNNISKEEVLRFKEFIESEKYIWDPLLYDVDNNPNSSNIILTVCIFFVFFI